MTLDRDVIHEQPLDYLRKAGRVFAEFGALTQDSGNVSYGVQIGAERYFVKTAGNPDDPEPFLNHSDRVALLRNAVHLSQSCQHSALPRLHRVIESPAGPMLVYQWVDGELLGVRKSARNDPHSSFQRFRALPPSAVETCLDTVYDLHRDLARLGWIGADFYDGCLIYDFRSSRLHVVDLDMYHQGPFQNEMGRLFGSSRFMAPEEFERGCLIDEQTTVFAMGRLAAIFLGDGTLTPDAFRGAPALYPVIARACQPDRSLRFPSVAAFHDQWRTALLA